MAFAKYLSGLNALDDDNLKQHLMKPNDIDVYWKPQDPILVEEPKKDSALLKQVRRARKYVWKSSGGAVDAYNRSSQKLSNAFETVENAYENAKKDPTVLIRPSCIIVAAAAGAVLPGRGRRPVMRLLGTSAFAATATAISYPKKAADLSIDWYKRGKEVGSTLVKSVRKIYEERSKVSNKEDVELQDKDEVDIPLQASEETNETVKQEAKNGIDSEQQDEDEKITEIYAVSEPDSLQSEKTENEKSVIVDQSTNETIQSPEDLSSIIKTAENVEHSPKEIEGDFGQSDPEDKDMYSTR